jgi:hypothetical protein
MTQSNDNRTRRVDAVFTGRRDALFACGVRATSRATACGSKLIASLYYAPSFYPVPVPKSSKTPFFAKSTSKTATDLNEYQKSLQSGSDFKRLNKFD